MLLAIKIVLAVVVIAAISVLAGFFISFGAEDEE